MPATTSTPATGTPALRGALLPALGELPKVADLASEVGTAAGNGTTPTDAFAVCPASSTQRGLIAGHAPYEHYSDVFFIEPLPNARVLRPKSTVWMPLPRIPLNAAGIGKKDLDGLTRHVQNNFPEFRLPSFTFLSTTKADLAARFLMIRGIEFVNEYLPFTESIDTAGDQQTLIENYLAAEEFLRYLFYVTASNPNSKADIAGVLSRTPLDHRDFIVEVLEGRRTIDGTIAPKGKMNAAYLYKLEAIAEFPWLDKLMNGNLFIDMTTFNALFPHNKQFIEANGGDFSKEAQIFFNIRRMGNRWLDAMVPISTANLLPFMEFASWAHSRLQFGFEIPSRVMEDIVASEFKSTIPAVENAKDIIAAAIAKFLYLAIGVFVTAHKPLKDIDLSLEELYIIRKLFRSKFRETLVILKASGMPVVDDLLFEKIMKTEIASHIRGDTALIKRAGDIAEGLLTYFSATRRGH